MEFCPHVLATLPLRQGQIAYVDVALAPKADPGAFEVCQQCEDGSYAPVLLIDPVKADQLRTVGHCVPNMVWGRLHPKYDPARVVTFSAPHDGVYAVTQERGIGVKEASIKARMSVKNGPTEKLRRFLGRCRWALSRFALPRSEG